MANKARIAILTGGGDCPGINAVIRAVAKRAILEFGWDVIGIEDGFDGIVSNRYRRLKEDDVSGIITMGGTILGTSNTANPYRYAMKGNGKVHFEDKSDIAIKNLQQMGIDSLVCIGGDGTLSIAYMLAKDGVPVVGVPKTIDNDLRGTDITFGFDSAVHVATEGIDRIHSTAQSHHRVMIVEVMGRNAGWIALHAGIAGGGDIVLIPEIPYDIEVIAEKAEERSRKGKRFSIVVVAEGAKPKGGDCVVKRIVEESPEPVRLGGVGSVIGAQVERLTGIETRTVVLGHLQRGGIPTPFDRVLATKLGTKTVELITRQAYGFMPGVRGDTLVEVSLEDVSRGTRTVNLDHPLMKSASSTGVCFGSLLNQAACPAMS